MNSTAPGPAPAPAEGTSSRRTPAPAAPLDPRPSTLPHSAVCTPVLPPRIRIPLPALELYCGPVCYRTAPVELVAHPVESGAALAGGLVAECGMPSEPEGNEAPATPATHHVPRATPSSLLPPPASLQSPAPLPTVHSAPRLPYSLRKGLGVWHLVFAGQEAVLRHERGLLYVAWLLQHPPAQPIHAVDLAAKIPELYHAQLGVGTPTASSAGPSAPLASQARLQERSLALDDVQALRALRRKEQELEAILDDESESEPVKAEALRELEAIAQFVRQRGHRSCDAAGRTVRMVRQSIKRLHASLAAALDAQGAPHPVLRPFAGHLHRHLLVPSGRYATRGNRFARTGLSGCFTYEPPPGVVWH